MRMIKETAIQLTPTPEGCPSPITVKRFPASEPPHFEFKFIFQLRNVSKPFMCFILFLILVNLYILYFLYISRLYLQDTKIHYAEK